MPIFRERHSSRDSDQCKDPEAECQGSFRNRELGQKPRVELSTGAEK